MKDFDRYSKEFYMASSSFIAEMVTKSYQLPNSADIHNMICGYKGQEFKDATLFDSAESIDYKMYEKELWKIEKNQ